MNTPTSTAMLRYCPLCGDKAVLRRSDEICSECIVDLTDNRDCKALQHLIDAVTTVAGPIVVADINIHSGRCNTCPGVISTVV